MPGLRLLALQSISNASDPVAIRELVGSLMLLTAVESRVGAMAMRYLSQRPQSRLQPSLRLSSSLKSTPWPPPSSSTSAQSDRSGAENSAPGWSPPLFHVREVRRSQADLEMLWKEHLPGWTLGCTPHLHPPLQRCAPARPKPTGILSLQELEHRLGLKPGVVLKTTSATSLQTSMNGWPGPPAHRRCQIALATAHDGDSFAPSWRPIPAWTPQSPGFFSVFINANNLRTCLSCDHSPPLR